MMKPRPSETRLAAALRKLAGTTSDIEQVSDPALVVARRYEKGDRRPCRDEEVRESPRESPAAPDDAAAS